MKNEENEEDCDDDNDSKEKGVVRSSVSFSSEKEVEEPWPLPLF